MLALMINLCFLSYKWPYRLLYVQPYKGCWNKRQIGIRRLKDLKKVKKNNIKYIFQNPKKTTIACLPANISRYEIVL